MEVNRKMKTYMYSFPVAHQVTTEVTMEVTMEVRKLLETCVIEINIPY